MAPAAGAVCVCVYILERNYRKNLQFSRQKGLFLKDPGQGLNSMDQSGSVA